MAMSMQELFYGESEPVHFVHYGRQSSDLPYSHARIGHQIPVSRGRYVELTTFDLMVPMCCTECEGRVQEALLAMGGVRDVVCDPCNPRVTVTGYVDPVQALQQVRRVKSGATFWSGSSAHRQRRYEVCSYQKSHRVQEDTRERQSYAQYIDAREQRSYSNRSHNRASGEDSCTRSYCPAYRDSATTHYVSLNPTIATRVEREC